MTMENRHEPRAGLAIQMLGGDFGRRWHIGDRREDSDIARRLGRGRTARKRHHFSITSARPPRGLRMLLGPLGITTPVIGFNGGVVASSDLSVITEHLLSPEVARRAVDMLDAQRAGMGVQRTGLADTRRRGPLCRA